MPSMGADMTEGTIAKWLKAEGDAVGRGDKLAEIGLKPFVILDNLCVFVEQLQQLDRRVDLR